MSLTTIIGRGHGGTRAMSHTLSASGVFMGEPLNDSGDLLPPEPMYDACRVFARYVTWRGGFNWDWSQIFTVDIPEEFHALIDTYLSSVHESPMAEKGWKIPETTLVFPWITQMFPDARYIFWIRDPRDSILAPHVTDDLSDFHIKYPKTDDDRLRRAISWRYQHDLVMATPKPKNWIEVRFEDFVLKQEETLAKLEDFLGMTLAKLPVRPEAVGRWKTAEGTTCYDFLRPAMAKYGYDAS